MHITHDQVYRTLSVALTALVMVTMGFFTFLLSTRISKLSKEGQTYTRYNSCVLSIPALDRDVAKIERCWDEVQKETGFEVKRYDR